MWVRIPPYTALYSSHSLDLLSSCEHPGSLMARERFSFPEGCCGSKKRQPGAVSSLKGCQRDRRAAAYARLTELKG